MHFFPPVNTSLGRSTCFILRLPLRPLSGLAESWLWPPFFSWYVHHSWYLPIVFNLVLYGVFQPSDICLRWVLSHFWSGRSRVICSWGFLWYLIFPCKLLELIRLISSVVSSLVTGLFSFDWSFGGVLAGYLSYLSSLLLKMPQNPRIGQLVTASDVLGSFFPSFCFYCFVTRKVYWSIFLDIRWAYFDSRIS